LGERIRIGVLLEQPGGQVAAEFASPLLALVEGDEVVLVRGGEHQVERGGRVGQKAAAQFLVIGLRDWGCVVHDGVPKTRRRKHVARLS
jgi:hypothetical protein